MTDVIERAEALLALPGSELGIEGVFDQANLVPELIAELKAARAENERLRKLLAPPEVDPNWAYNTCCGKCTGGTCYVDQMTGA